ncbi:ABC transporter ATP-binding protein [Listeria ilorinensis]|uniref:ABC transporter ATP-binding protein n=1 Tax=Listeria ilorinensis TaxID=2867439 RepID=UPI001EF55C25|nr:ABC transporter ATP-binding protein [Listeria ilorinensis]
MFEFSQVFYEHKLATILSNINWKVKAGEHWALLGLNGSGKTTLLQLLNGYIWPSKGRISVLGETFGQTALPELRKSIGWVSKALEQQLKNSDTSEKIVLSGKYASIGLYVSPSPSEWDEAKQVLIDAGGEHLIGKPYQILSQGERQIVLIARALMAKPRILILDEPCNGLDLFARESLLFKIEQLAQNKDDFSIIFVTHHSEEISASFKKTLLLQNGQVFAQGATTELLNELVLADFYEKPVKIIHLPGGRIALYPANIMI